MCVQQLSARLGRHDPTCTSRFYRVGDPSSAQCAETGTDRPTSGAQVCANRAPTDRHSQPQNPRPVFLDFRLIAPHSVRVASRGPGRHASQMTAVPAGRWVFCLLSRRDLRARRPALRKRGARPDAVTSRNRFAFAAVTRGVRRMSERPTDFAAPWCAKTLPTDRPPDQSAELGSATR